MAKQTLNLSCSGECVEQARQAFDRACAQAKPESGDMAALSKRFSVLRDINGSDPHQESEITLEHALALYEASFGQEHPAVAEIMLALADVYRNHGKSGTADYMNHWAEDILQTHREEPVHEFFHLFGMDVSDQPDSA